MNPFVVSVFCAWFLAQIIGKTIVVSWRKGRFYPTAAFYQAGMPSGHSALVSAICVATYFAEGLATVFYITLAFSVLIIYDVLFVREMFIRHATASLVGEMYHIGHRPAEVGVGVIIGILTVLVVYPLV
ncbi:divergent PAP2 family protein [Candidatus Woesearchaeota archaeon]|nr:divergent PAP2 family protein [Candidatus Woesearchaeota archaeon]